MARKDYPWSIPDIKFGSNLVVNSILLIFVIGFYAITGVVYLILFIIDWVKEYKSKNNPIDKNTTGDGDKKRKKSLHIKGKQQETTKKEKIIGALIIIGNMLALLFAILGEYGLI